MHAQHCWQCHTLVGYLLHCQTAISRHPSIIWSRCWSAVCRLQGAQGAHHQPGDFEPASWRKRPLHSRHAPRPGNTVARCPTSLSGAAADLASPLQVRTTSPRPGWHLGEKGRARRWAAQPRQLCSEATRTAWQAWQPPSSTCAQLPGTPPCAFGLPVRPSALVAPIRPGHCPEHHKIGGPHDFAGFVSVCRFAAVTNALPHLELPAA